MAALKLDYYRVLLEVTNVLNSQRDSESLWKAITGHIKAIMPWERAGITLYHPELDGFKFYAVETILPKVILQRSITIPLEGSGIGWAFENKKVHIRPNLQEKQVFWEDKFYYEEGLGRIINLPLLVRDTCIGTLNIASIQTGDPDNEDLEFLGQVATQIALAIDHVRAYEKIKALGAQLAQENQYLLEEIRASHNFGALIGASRALQEVQQLAQAVAPTNSTVLLTGETGTGKELLAWRIHELSPRRDKAFVRVNCAGLPLSLVESELFGHERGAFTGAEQRRPGRFELAHGGTLFLDEIGELPLEAQAKLLRVLQDGMVDKLGGTQSVPVDVRIIAATNSDLRLAVEAGRFRSDLYFRLDVFPIMIPPLRDRPEDIPLLVRYFINKFNRKLKRFCETVQEETLQRLVEYRWPGNVRELRNILERAMILMTGNQLKVEPQLLESFKGSEKDIAPSTLEEVEKEKILETLEKTGWRVNGKYGAAQKLGLNPSTLRSRMKKLGIERYQPFGLFFLYDSEWVCSLVALFA